MEQASSPQLGDQLGWESTIALGPLGRLRRERRDPDGRLQVGRYFLVLHGRSLIGRFR